MRTVLVLLSLLWAVPAGVPRDCAMAGRTLFTGPFAELRVSKMPHLRDALLEVSEKAGVAPPLLCEYAYGLVNVPHVSFPAINKRLAFPVIYMPDMLAAGISKREALGIFGHEVAHVVRKVVPRSVFEQAREEREVDSLAASWVGPLAVAAGMRSLERIGRERGDALMSPSYLDTERMRALERRSAEEEAQCRLSYDAQARACRGWEGRDNDACFMRIRPLYEACEVR